jgi:hypothetical protein
MVMLGFVPLRADFELGTLTIEVRHLAERQVYVGAVRPPEGVAA